MTGIAASIIVMLAACKKGSNESAATPIPKIAQVYSLKISGIESVANLQNPYDYIGAYHNVILDSLRHYVKANNDTPAKGKEAYLHTYFKKHLKIDFTLIHDPKERLACTDYKALMLTQNVSEQAKVFFKDLSNALQGIKDLDHYERYRENIMAVEKAVLAANLPDNEKKNLLMTAAILRYSGYYWINAFKNGEVTYHSESNGMAMPDSFLRKIAGVIVGIAADGSVLAFSSFCGDPDIIGTAITMSEVCGYYTGWY